MPSTRRCVTSAGRARQRQRRGWGHGGELPSRRDRYEAKRAEGLFDRGWTRVSARRLLSPHGDVGTLEAHQWVGMAIRKNPRVLAVGTRHDDGTSLPVSSE